MGKIGTYSEETFLTIFLAKPYFSVQIVQGENRLKRLIFSEFFVDVQVVQSHLGEIGKIMKKSFFINVQVVQAHLGEIGKYSEEILFIYVQVVQAHLGEIGK